MSLRLKTVAEFKEYARADLLPRLQKLEKIRIIIIRKIIYYVINSIIIIVLMGLLLGYFAKFKYQFIFYFYFCSLFPALYLWINYYHNHSKLYSSMFKEEIIGKIVHFIDDNHNLSYAVNIQDDYQTLTLFGLSQLFDQETKYPDFLEQEDCIFGNIEGTNIFFSRIFVQKNSPEKMHLLAKLNSVCHKISGGNFLVTKGLQMLFFILLFFTIKLFFLIILWVDYKTIESSESSAKSQQKTDIFKGLFFVAKFPKNFERRIFILPHNFTNKINLQQWRGKKINLEDSEFNKIFCVYGDSQLESRYILSTNLMNRLVQFQKKAQRDVYISFIEGHVFIAIPYYHNLFEPKIFKSMLYFAPLKEYFETLQLMIGIVKDLNLNQKSWEL